MLEATCWQFTIMAEDLNLGRVREKFNVALVVKVRDTQSGPLTNRSGHFL